MIELSTDVDAYVDKYVDKSVDKYVDNLGERRITTKLRITANTTERLLFL